MATSPVPEPTVEIPSNSTSIDTVYPIVPENLNILSNVAKSSLLAVTNLGSSLTSKINNALAFVRTLENFNTYLLDSTAIDSLSNNSSSSSFQILNVGTSRLVKVIVILGEITPNAVSPRVLIVNNNTAYGLDVSTSTSEKRLEFNNIPSSFVTNFVVKNETGVSFASYGNSIIVIGL